ncbi:hypothetical protein TWF281_003901 [Arthrobotrys megalospora]
MYAEVARTHLSTIYLRSPKLRNHHRCSAHTLCPGLIPWTSNHKPFTINRRDDGDSYKTINHLRRYALVAGTTAREHELVSASDQEHKGQPILYLRHWKSRQNVQAIYLANSHRRRTCAQLLSSGHSSQSIAAQWRGNHGTVRLPMVGAYLASTGRDRILLRLLEGYMTAATSQKSNLDMIAGCKVLIWCIENIHKRHRSKTISFESSRSRAERIASLLIHMNQCRLGLGADPISIGANRIKFLLHLLTPESTFRLFNTLLLSKSDVPERVLLSILHALTKAGMFVQALQVFQKLALSPVRHGDSLLLRTWQFRRLFLKLYQAGIPIHKSDIMGFFSSLGLMDPLIYKLLVYAAAGVNDANSVARLTRDYEARTGNELPLDVMCAVFLMHHRLGDSGSLNNTYSDAQRRGLQPLSDSFFVTAVMLVEAHRDNASYWELCGLYRRFFKPLALNLLELPLPIQREMSTSGDAYLEPTTGTLTIMLHSYLRTVAGKLEGSRYALTIYKRYIHLLRNGGTALQFKAASEHFIACIVSAVAKYKPNLGLALGIVQDMIDFDDLPHPTSLTWDSLLRASTVHGDVNISEKIWEAMLEHGIPPTTHTYGAMITLYATTGDHNKSEILRSRMMEEGWAITMHLQQVMDFAERKRKYKIIGGVTTGNS